MSRLPSASSSESVAQPTSLCPFGPSGALEIGASFIRNMMPSTEITTEGKDATDTLQDLIGLDGARLTGIESDQESLDLIFDSIRISVSSDQ